jgi:hypothetical protein
MAFLPIIQPSFPIIITYENKMKKSLIIVQMCLLAHFCEAQKNWNTRDSVARGVSISVSTGISHYINTLQPDPSRVSLRQNFSCSSFRFMWEPEHRLSMGIEDINIASLSVTPILFCVQMRIFKNFFATVGTGISIHHSDVNYLGNQSESQTMAFSNLQFGGGYVYPVTKQFGLGLKAQFLSENRTEDGIFSVQAVARYQFKKRFRRVRERE